MHRGFVSHLAGRPVLRRVLVPIGCFITVVVAGIVGFSVLGGVGLLEAAFWLVDLTSIELHFQEHAGAERATKAYAIVVTAGLVLSGLWIGETVVTEMFGGRIPTEVSRATMQRRIDDSDEHVIVCGYGMFGRTIANRLAAAGRTVVVIESDEDIAERVRTDGHLLVEGDARQEQTLRAAGVERATKLVAAIDDSNINIQIAVVSGTAADAPEIIVRVGEEMYESVAKEAGADAVIIPEVVSGERVTRLLERPAD